MNPTLKAAVWMTGAILSFSSMAIAGRSLAGELSSFEIMMYRSFIGVIIIVIVGTAFGKFGEVRVDRLRLHLGERRQRQRSTRASR